MEEWGEQERKRAMDKALHYLGFRPRSVAQMRAYLGKKEFSPESIDAVIERLEEYGYLNDADLAARVVENETKTRGVGLRVAKQKLYRSGIDNETAQAAIDGVAPETERENARALARKLAAKLTDEDPIKRKQKLYRRLLAKGFSYDVAKEALRAALEQTEGEGDDTWE